MNSFVTVVQEITFAHTFIAAVSTEFDLLLKISLLLSNHIHHMMTGKVQPHGIGPLKETKPNFQVSNKDKTVYGITNCIPKRLRKAGQFLQTGNKRANEAHICIL